MIIEAICNLFFGVAHLILNLIPDLPDMSTINKSLQPVFWTIKMINIFVDIKTLSSAAVLLLVVYNLRFVWSLLMWLVRKIPGVS